MPQKLVLTTGALDGVNVIGALDGSGVDGVFTSAAGSCLSNIGFSSGFERNWIHLMRKK